MEKKIEWQQVYVVDDDESVCRALRILLETYGFSVKTFIRAEDFLNAVPNSTPGCLILDIHMPGLSGWQTQQRLRESGSRLPVIMISGEKFVGNNERALKAGAVGYLQKPFNDLALVNLIYVSAKKRLECN